MFTINQIKEAHSKVKSGADFPNYIQDLIKLGVASYDTFVADGHSDYYDGINYKINSEAKYPNLKIAETSDAEKFIQYLKMHQQGQTNYPNFCTHSAETGVEKWKVDLTKMTCTYFNLKGDIMLVETIPTK